MAKSVKNQVVVKQDELTLTTNKQNFFNLEQLKKIRHKTPSSISPPAIRLHSVSRLSTTSRPVRRLPVRRRHLLLRNLPRAAKAGSGMTAPAMAEEAPSRRNRARTKSLLA